jgi:hypothetical protein
MKTISIAHYRPWRKTLWIAYWTVAPWLVDRLPWFVKKPLMNLLFGEEVYHNLMRGPTLGI